MVKHDAVKEDREKEVGELESGYSNHSSHIAHRASFFFISPFHFAFAPFFDVNVGFLMDVVGMLIGFSLGTVSFASFTIQNEKGGRARRGY